MNKEEPTPRTVPKVNVKPAIGASWVVPFTRLEEIQIRHYLTKDPENISTLTELIPGFYPKPPESLSAVDAKEFLTWLAAKKQIAASTQIQALNALLSFYRNVTIAVACNCRKSFFNSVFR